MIATIIGLTLLLFVVLGGLFWCYRFCFYSPLGNQNDYDNLPPEDQYIPFLPAIRALIAELKERPCEEVRVTSFDGLRLAGKYYHTRQDGPLVIFFHGYRSTSFRDGCGGIKLLTQMGCNVLMVDQRAHRDSQGHTITFGVKERQDVLSWVDFALRRFGADTQILLYGISMGGATVLMSSELALPTQVKGIIADCPYANVRDIMIKTGTDMGLPAWLYPMIRLSAKLFGGFDPADGDAARAVRQAKVPILVIHGEDDRFVPQEMSLEVCKANPAIRRETFPNAAHGISFLLDVERYAEVLQRFMEETLDQPG